MSTFRWTFVAAAIAATCLAVRPANAQYAYYRYGGAEISAGTPAYPAATAVQPYSGGPALTAAPAGPMAPAIPSASGATASPMAGVGESCYGEGCEAGCMPGCGGDPAWRAWGDYLFLRARNEGVEYAVPLDISNTVQVGPTSTMNPEFSSGFRVGFDRALDASSEIAVQYTYYRDENTNGFAATTPSTLDALVLTPPNIPGVTQNWTTAVAHEITKFQYVDLDYRHNLWGCDCACINYFVGMRYAELAQEFDATYTDPVLGTANAATNVTFDGLGLRLGLDGERAIRGGFYGAAKFDANFIGGEFSGNYTSNNPAAGAIDPTAGVVSTNWSEARFTTILETELTVGWQSPNGRIRFAIGYLLTDWLNAVKPNDFINTVQTNSFRGANQLGTTSLVFDGLVGHVELAW